MNRKRAAAAASILLVLAVGVLGAGSQAYAKAAGDKKVEVIK
ncbi:hypothetical protein [Streptomyces subrutilus]|uniref:Uncharacterized protein n=1 Tax=Streptomyces subrutilus TaxID=36818 RepID=A0A918V687_9ACTN|nr:hypothetical protein [Streptomyces subrutilus]WSJ28472.1 hypothetical protein OG479_03680 [Streptomyces subrutilus]GGZ72988.1 hypothetical protein GCM10010371_36200 [Streptomyces subrutilus]